MNQFSSCVFDLETTNLNADFGVVLCGVILPSGPGAKPIVFRADKYPTWKTNRSNDAELVKDIVKELDCYDIWCGHNASRFDVPFLRTRLLRHKLPPLPTRKLVDPVLLARNKLRMSFNSLAQVANLLGINSKTELKPEMWLAASLDGCTKSIGYIVDHCVQDCVTLDKVVGALKHYSTTLNSYGSGF